MKLENDLVTETCTYTLRAETGPCETCGHGVEALAEMLPGIEGSPLHCTACCLEGLAELPEGWRDRPGCQHPYLGPSLGVCGHAEDEHGEDQEVDLDNRPIGPVYDYCGPCVDVDAYHADHTFQPAAEENAHA